MNSIKKILPPQPHYLSGYTGYVPGYKFHSGQSYGRLTHSLFLDPRIKRSDIPVLTDLTKVQRNWLSREEETAIADRCHFRKCNYGIDMVPGYKGYVPQDKFLCGNNFALQSAMAIAIFEKMKRECLCPECREIQQSTYNNQIIEDDVNEHTRPSRKVLNGEKLFKEKYEPRPAVPPSGTPYFLENENPHKRFMTGFAGHVPNLIYCNGVSYNPATNQALKVFTTRYEKLKTNSWKPIIIETGNNNARTEPKSISQKLPYEKGIIKNYAGHIPGDLFNVGKTFSEGSKNTRNILGLQ